MSQLITAALLFVLGVPISFLLIGTIYGLLAYWLDRREMRQLKGGKHE